MTWHIEVDRERCMGSAVCAGTAPDLFTMDADRSRPVRPDVEPDEEVLDVADSCPVMAIEVLDGGKVIAPRP
ncbi:MULTISPECIES: ferredoxin [Streptomyces]|nr:MULTISPECIES: ferredoxin [Streptomyces]MCC3649959.1 ferredoxin [Streptomyces sp. S07_1.15]MCC5037078.1 ferredoxin [Streptomyces sp. WAC 00631]MCC9737685.1 ferredoxin [Streptomyces sp. MNU89]WSQ75018.1 ferredoxin [Streptomyces xinghaiensis]